MTDYNDGKIHGWNGGECPVHPATRIKFWTDEGYFECDAGLCRWSEDTTCMDFVVVAFRVTKVHREPKTIWVNEYERIKSGWDTEEEARQRGIQHGAVRIAVKYQEVIEND